MAYYKFIFIFIFFSFSHVLILNFSFLSAVYIIDAYNIRSLITQINTLDINSLSAPALRTLISLFEALTGLNIKEEIVKGGIALPLNDQNEILMHKINSILSSSKQLLHDNKKIYNFSHFIVTNPIIAFSYITTLLKITHRKISSLIFKKIY